MTGKIDLQKLTQGELLQLHEETELLLGYVVAAHLTVSDIRDALTSDHSDEAAACFVDDNHNSIRDAMLRGAMGAVEALE